MRKKLIRPLFACMLLLFLNGIVFANGTVQVHINGQPIEFNDSTGYPFISEEGRTMVPFRIALEKIEAKVDWDGVNRHAIAMKKGVMVIAPIGEKRILRNGIITENDVATVIKNNRTYMPLKSVMEAFGYAVDWNGGTRTVSITGDAVAWTPKFNEAGLPIRFDLRDENLVTAPKDQGNKNTCWAFAGIGALESRAAKSKHYDFSEDHLILNSLYKIDYESGGNRDMVVAYLTSWKGPVLEIDDKYGDGETNEQVTAVKHVQEIFYINKDMNAIKNALLDYGAVESSLYVADPESGATLDSNMNNKTHSYYYAGQKKTNHDVVIVGYDDGYSRDNFNTRPAKDGAFIVKNSWGEGWGENGYFYVSYYDSQIGTDGTVYFGVEPVSNYKNIYQHDEAGVTSLFGYDQMDEAYMANVFTKEPGDEALAAVSFYTLGQNSEYEIYLVPDYQGVASLSEARTKIKSGVIKEEGYHTIKLGRALGLKAERFAIEVKIKTPGSLRPIGIEDMTDQLKPLPRNFGQSFVSHDGVEWVDLQETYGDAGGNGNVCLKGFTE